MKTVKKILSLMLVAAMLLSVMPGQWIAAAEAPQLVIGSAAVDVSNGAATCVIPVEFKNNPGIVGLTLDATIPDGWSMVTKTEDGKYSDYYIQDQQNDYSILCSTMSFNGTTLATGAMGYFLVNLNTGRVVWANADVCKGDGKLVYLTYSVPADAANGNYEISLKVTDLTSLTTQYKDQTKVTVGTVTVTGGVDKLTQDNTTVSGVASTYTYTGSAIEPVPVISYGGKTLTAGTDYTVSYADNMQPGTATITITGAGAYQGTVTKNFVIGKAEGKITGTATYTKQYGDAVFALDAKANSGAKLSYQSSNESVAKIDTTGKVTVLGAGSAIITVSAGETDCYTAPVDYKVNVTVGMAAQTLSGTKSYEKVYGDAAFKLDTKGAKGALSYETTNPAVATVENGTVTVKGVGTTTITVKAAEVAGKYAETSMTVSITVAKKEITVSGITASNKTYDGNTTVSVNQDSATLSGKLSGDDVTVAATGKFEDAAAGTDKKVLLDVSLTGADAGNYVLSADSQTETTATIEKAKVASPTAKSGLVFNAQEQTGVEETKDYTVTGGTAVNAGSHVATVELKDPANYQWDGEFSGQLTWNMAQAQAQELSYDVTRRYSSTQTIAITAADAAAKMQLPGEVTLKNWAVSDSDHILTGANGEYALTEGLKASDAGKSATITVDVESENYQTSTLTVTVKVIDKNDVSEGLSFTDGSGDYTGLAHTYENALYNGSSNGIRYTYNEVPVNVGTYTVTAIYEDEDNYGEATATYTVNPVEVKIASGTVTTKTYDGQDDAEVTDVTFRGTVNGELLDAADYTVTNASFTDVNVGSGKTVTYTVALNDTEKASNYVLKTAQATSNGIIEPKTIAVTIDAIANQTYSGFAKKPAVKVLSDETVNSYVLAENTDYTVTYSNNTNAGTASVVVAAKKGSNYTFGNVNGSFEITKLAAPELSVSELTVKYSAQGSKTVTITGIPSNAGTATYTVGSMSGETDMVSAVAAANGKITVTLTAVEESKIGATVTIPVTVEMTNYETATVNLIVTRSDKDTPVVAAQDIVKTYDGKKLTSSAIQGTATFNGTVLSGTWSWVTDPATMVEVGAYNATVCFTPDDAANYAAAEASVLVTVKKAQIAVPDVDDSDDAETLEDLLKENDFVDADGNVIPGTLTWYDEDGNQLDADTEIEEGVSYTWKFEPDDKKNYESLIGTYERNNSSSVLIWAAILGGAAGGTNFDDISRNDWYADAVNFVVQEGLFEGVSEKEFQPNGNMTRAMLVTVLWRLEGQPKIYGYADFDDVSRNTWYTQAVAWASKYGVVEGISENKFAPDASITREQMATLLFRYAKYKGLDISASAALTAFADGSAVSGYAQNAMEWTVTFGLMEGMNGKLMPQGTATRAQVATILMRFVQWFGL